MAVKYFAYGSNMADSVMSEKAPRHRFLGVARLPGHRLKFNRRSVRTGTGVADVEPAAGADVWGVLYEIDDEGLSALDRKEGYDWAYLRVQVTVELAGDGSRRAPAVTYVVKAKEPAEVDPSSSYLEGIIAAARMRGLPPGYVDSLTALRDRLLAAGG